jgi:hypothetical protein
MSLKNSPNNRVTNNPYLVGAVPQAAPKLTVWGEAKRLLGSPGRFLATLFLVLAPGLLAVSGGLDFLSTWLYTLSHHVQSDPRPTVNLLECIQDQTKELCRGVVWASPASSQRMTLYPWHDAGLINRYEPWLFIGFFALAFLSFAAIGNPKAARIGQTFNAFFGFKKVGGAKGKDNLFDLSPEPENGPVPRALLDLEHPGDFWNKHLLLGEFVPRHWETNPGYFWFDADAKPIPYWLNLNILRTGVVIVAPQGSGKTASIFKPLRTFVDRSRSMGIFFDVKSSENANGTGTDFPPELFDLNFDAARPDSIKLNLFAGQTPAQAGERLAEALIPDLGGDKAYFSNNAKSAMATIVSSFHAIFNSYPTLVQILNYLSNPENLGNLHKRLLNRVGGPQGADFLRLSTLLQRVINLSQNRTTDTLGNLATALEPLVTDVAARLLVTNPESGAYTVEQLLKEPRLIRLALPVANNPRIYPIIGRLVLAQFTYGVLSPECNRQLFKLIAVDEARFFITDNVANGMAQARSSNAGYALSFQTLTQIRDETLLDNIFANAGSKLVMGKVGDKDAERFSRLFGIIELPYLSHSSGTNQGTNRNNGHSYSRGSEFEFMSSGLSGYESRATRATNSGHSASSGSSQGTNLSTRARRRFMDSEVRELEQRHAIIESSDDHGRQWFAQVINMDARRVKELELEVSKEIVRLVRKGFKGKIQIQPLAITIKPPAQPEVEIKVTKGLKGVKTQTLRTPKNGAVTRRLPKPQPIVVEGEVILASEIEAEAEDENEQEVTKELLRSIGLPENEVNELARIIADTNHNDADLIRLIKLASTRHPDAMAEFVASMIRSNKYPGRKSTQP